MKTTQWTTSLSDSTSQENGLQMIQYTDSIGM